MLRDSVAKVPNGSSASTIAVAPLGSAAPFGQIIRQKEPENFEFLFPTLSTFLTPNDQFYVRSHFPKPMIDASAWRLKVEGAVEKEIEVSLAGLMAMASQKRTITLECAGNGRVFLVPKQNGAQWELGAVSNAEWTGVLLSDVLALAGTKTTAVEVVFEGADEGHPDESPKPSMPIHYARGIPISKIDDVILAYAMNGEPLSASHGAPVRAVVGGWFGMASVKWLSRIVLTDEPFRGYFQAVDYAYWESLAGMPIHVPITEMMLKAQIARPALHEIIPPNSIYRVVGAAWTGDSLLNKVEVSTDGGKSYSGATLLGGAVRHAWQLWEYLWKTPSVGGTYTLFARAADTNGRTQPSEHDQKFGSYVICHTLPIEVQVKETR